MSSIDKRIKVFNKLLKEFHDALNVPFKFVKITKYIDIKNFKESLTDNISLIIQKNLEVFNIKEIKILYKYKESENLIESNKEVIFTFIKNMYYTTFEDKEEADKIKDLLSLEIDTNSILDFFNNDKNGLMKIVTDMAHEILPEVQALDIKNIETIDIQNLIQSALKGNLDLESLSDKINIEEKEKVKQLIELIKIKVEQKINSGVINKNMLKDLMKYFNKTTLGRRI